MNYCYGNCVLCVEGDDNIYSVKPYYKGIELELNTGYLKDGVVYIYRGDIAKQKKFRNGVFTNTKGQVIFAMPEADKPKYVFDNIKAALETKSTPDGKKGSMTIANFEKWLEILDMEIEIKIRDSDESDLPCGKEFKFTTQDGYSVDWVEGYDYIKEELEDEDNE